MQQPIIRDFQERDITPATRLWNQILTTTDTFPGDEVLTEAQALEMFRAQSATRCLWVGEELAGLYILHPNNIGRCGHIANASYAVTEKLRGQGLGRLLVQDSLEAAGQCGYRGLQFNAVVATNTRAVALYLKLGFHIIGTIPGGFRRRDGSYADTLIFLKSWAG